MNSLMVDGNGHRYEDPTSAAIESATSAIVWSGTNNRLPDKVISSFGWSIRQDSMTKAHSLRDCTGEVRPIRWGTYEVAIQHPSWQAYDQVLITEQLEWNKLEVARLKSLVSDQERRISVLESAMADIYGITERGGHHSRVQVKQIIAGVGGVLCPNCGFVTCCCGDQ